MQRDIAPESSGEKANTPDKLCFSGARILICEDNETDRNIVSGLLETFGIEPVIAEDGEKAVELLDERQFDLILTDITPPVLNGHNTALKIRSSEKPYKSIPIIAIAAAAFQEKKDVCFAAGMNGFIIKPVSGKELYTELAKWLANGSGAGLPPCRQAEAALDVPSIEGVDTGEGLKRFPKKPEKYLMALERFSKELSSDIADIYKSMAAGEINGARILVHKTKGVAGNLGAMELYEAARVFEALLIEGKNSDIEYDRFIQCAKTVIGGINAVLSGGEPSKTTELRPSAGKEEALLLLRELKKAAENFDPAESERKIETLRSKQWSGFEESMLEEIYRLVYAYEFDKAADRLDFLINR